MYVHDGKAKFRMHLTDYFWYFVQYAGMLWNKKQAFRKLRKK